MRFQITLVIIFIISDAFSIKIKQYDSAFEGGEKSNECGKTTTTSPTKIPSTSMTPPTTRTTWTTTTEETGDKFSTESSSQSPQVSTVPSMTEPKTTLSEKDEF